MIPTVFISSTVDDLRHIRDAVRATVEEVGYQPVMSEYGEIGYMGGDAAEDACYRTVPGCQLVVLIIGKRYGSAARNYPDKTITELEFEKALENNSRIITLVDKEVLGFKKVFDTNFAALLVCGVVEAGTAWVTLMIPVEMITATPTRFQLADDGDYISFNVFLDSGLIKLQIVGKSSSGHIYKVYGIF